MIPLRHFKEYIVAMDVHYVADEETDLCPSFETMLLGTRRLYLCGLLMLKWWMKNL